MRQFLTLALIILCPSPALAQSGMFGPRIAAVQQPPPVVVFTPAEARRIAHSLSRAEETQEENGILRQSLDLERQAKVAAISAANAYKAASELNAKRADVEARRADNEAIRATNEAALKDAARAQVKAERKKGRWNLIKGFVVGACIGLGTGAIVVASR